MSERLDRRRLIAQIQAGDRHVFKELYLRYFERVHAYMRLMLDDEAEAHAATQTAFRIALSELPAYRLENGSFEAWLCRFARRVAQGRAAARYESIAREERSHRPSDAGTDEEPEPDLDLPTIPDAHILDLIRQLPPSERELVILHHMFGLNAAELAATVERPADDVRTRHQQALAHLNGMLSSGPRPRAGCSSGSTSRRR